MLHKSLYPVPQAQMIVSCVPAVNTNISFPLTDWQLEVRMRWVKAAPVSASISKLTSIHEYFEAKPLRTKLYSVGLMCSPRWTLAWAWLFDREPGLRLLHTHIQQHQVSVAGWTIYTLVSSCHVFVICYCGLAELVVASS